MSRRTWLGLVIAACLFATLLVAVVGAPTRASAMEIDCSTVGGPGALSDYVESYGVKSPVEAEVGAVLEPAAAPGAALRGSTRSPRGIRLRDHRRSRGGEF